MTNNNCMIVLIVAITFFVLLFFPIKIKAKMIFNFLTNKGYISLFLLNFKVFLGKISVSPTKLVVQTKKRLSYLYFFGSKTQEDFGEIFCINLLQNIRLNDLRLIGRFGLFSNCLLTSLFCGGVMMGTGVLYPFLNAFRGQVPTSVSFFPSYIDNKMLFCFTSSILLNLFVILKSLIETICDFAKRRQKDGNKETY